MKSRTVMFNDSLSIFSDRSQADDPVSITSQEQAILRRVVRIGPALPADIPELAALPEAERGAILEALLRKDLLTGDGSRLQTTTLGYLEAWQDPA